MNYVLLIPLSYRCLKNVIRHVGSKNEWFLLSGAFTPKPHESQISSDLKLANYSDPPKMKISSIAVNR